MEYIALDVEGLHLGIADFGALLIDRDIERAFNLQAGQVLACRYALIWPARTCLDSGVC